MYLRTALSCAAIACLAFSTPIQARVAHAQFNQNPITGNWKIVGSRGLRLPRGDCRPGYADRLSLSFNTLRWSPGARRGLPTLSVRVTSGFIPFGFGARNNARLEFNVADRRGMTGVITVNGDTMQQRYANGVSVRFERCP